MNTTMLWGAGIVLALVVGWLLRGLMDRPRQAAERAVAQERMARLEAELTAARAAAAGPGPRAGAGGSGDGSRADGPVPARGGRGPGGGRSGEFHRAARRADAGSGPGHERVHRRAAARDRAACGGTGPQRGARTVGGVPAPAAAGVVGAGPRRALHRAAERLHRLRDPATGCRAPPRRGQDGRGGREGLVARDPRHRGRRPAGRGGRGTRPARTGGAKPRRQAGEQGVRPAVRHRAGVRGDVPARRVAARRSPGLRPRPARARLRSQRRPGNADHADGPDPHSRAHLAPGRAGCQRPGGPGPGSRAGRALGHDARAPGQAGVVAGRRA